MKIVRNIALAIGFAGALATAAVLAADNRAAGEPSGTDGARGEAHQHDARGMDARMKQRHDRMAKRHGAAHREGSQAHEHPQHGEQGTSEHRHETPDRS